MKPIHILHFAALASFFLVACHQEEPAPQQSCTHFRIRYITDVRTDNGTAYTNRYSFDYKFNGTEVRRNEINSANDTLLSDLVKYDSAGQLINWFNLVTPWAPTVFFTYTYQNNRLDKVEYESSISPGEVPMLQQTSYFFYNADQLIRVENEQPGFSGVVSKTDVAYSADGKTVTYTAVEVPSNTPIQTLRFHYTNLINPLAAFDLRFGWPDSRFLPDTIFAQQADGTFLPDTIITYESEDGRVLHSVASSANNPAAVAREVTYEYECD